jgi:hypothetical protein
MLDAVALAVEPLVVADHSLAVRLWRNDRTDAAPFEVITNGIGIVSLVGDECIRRLLRRRTLYN